MDAIPRRNWIAVMGGLIGAFMAILDIQITNASLKDIQGALSATLSESSWISTSYLVAEMIAIPLSGWLWMSAAETHRPISFFGLFIVPMLPVEQSKALAESFGEAHEIMGLATIGLIILHVAGALKHHFVGGTNLLERMIPGLRHR